MIETLKNDPDFSSIAHHGATKVMQAAHALANGNGNGKLCNGFDPRERQRRLDPGSAAPSTPAA
jgi:hypothetical protein